MELSNCHPNLKETNTLIAHLASATPFKLSRYKELHAKALGFKSFNGLVTMVKQNPVHFDTNVFLDNLIDLSLDVHGVRLKDKKDCESQLYEMLVNNRDYISDELAPKVRVARFDFQVLNLPSGEFETDYLIPALCDPEGFQDINAFIKSVQASGIPIGNIDWPSIPKVIESNDHNLGNDNSHFAGFSFNKTDFINSGALFFLTSSTGEYPVSNSDQYFSKAISTGFGSLLLLVDEDTEFTMNESHMREAIMMRAFEDTCDYEAPPSIAFVSPPIIKDYEVLPTEGMGHICHEYNAEELTPFEPHDYIEALSTPEANNRYVGRTYYEGVFSIPVGEHGIIDPDLLEDHHSGFSISVDVELKTVFVRRPSAASLYPTLGWDITQIAGDVHNQLRKPYETLERYRGFKVVDIPANVDTQFSTLRIDDVTFVEILDINIPLIGFKGLMGGEFNESIPLAYHYGKHLRTLVGVEDFISFLLRIGTNTVIYNELIEHSGGDNIGSVYVAYDEQGEEIMVFELRSAYGWTTVVNEFNKLLENLMPDGWHTGLNSEIEFGKKVKVYNCNNQWGSEYISVLKPMDK